MPKDSVLLLVGLENLAKIRCCNTNFRIEIGKRPLQHISATKSEAGACLAVCLKYQQFQPKKNVYWKSNFSPIT